MLIADQDYLVTDEVTEKYFGDPNLGRQIGNAYNDSLR